MEIKLDVLITENKTTIYFPNNQGSLEILELPDNQLETAHPAVYFLIQDKTIVAIGRSDRAVADSELDYNKQIIITPPWDIELDYLEQLFIIEATENGIQLTKNIQHTTKIPTNSKKTVASYKENILLVLTKFGYSFNQQEKPKKAKPAKARHKWTKEVSQIEFFIDTRDSKATVLWHKRNEMLLKAGATMMLNPPLNKDGSLGFSAKMGQRIREDHKDKVKNFTTTEDILLKSVNEVGLFLYFGGTNSWLELIDANGKTLNEWTVV